MKEGLWEWQITVGPMPLGHQKSNLGGWGEVGGWAWGWTHFKASPHPPQRQLEALITLRRSLNGFTPRSGTSTVLNGWTCSRNKQSPAISVKRSNIDEENIACLLDTLQCSMEWGRLCFSLALITVTDGFIEQPERGKKNSRRKREEQHTFIK